MQNLNPSDVCFFFSDSPFSGGSPPHSQMCEFPILNKDSLVCVVDMPLRAISPPWLPAGPPSLWCPASCSTYRTRRSLETTTHGRRVGIRRQITWVHSSRLRVVGDGGLRASRSGLENFMQRRKWKAWATRRGIARRRSRRWRRIQRIQRILVSYSIMAWGPWFRLWCTCISTCADVELEQIICQLWGVALLRVAQMRWSDELAHQRSALHLMRAMYHYSSRYLSWRKASLFTDLFRVRFKSLLQSQANSIAHNLP